MFKPGSTLKRLSCFYKEFYYFIQRSLWSKTLAYLSRVSFFEAFDTVTNVSARIHTAYQLHLFDGV